MKVQLFLQAEVETILYDAALKEQTTENKVEKEDSGALKTDEILSLLSKTRQDFIKDQEILEKIPNLFKKKL